MLALLAAGVKYTVDLRHERQRALGAVDQAERAREEAEQVSRFLVGVFELADPRRARGRDITAREILDEGVARLEDLEHQPEAQGRLLSTVGEVYYKLGYYHEAKTLLGRALAAQERVSGGGDDTELATTLARLGETCRFLDEYACARELLGKALAMRRRLHPGGHPELAASLLDLGRLSYDEGRLEESVGFLEESAAMLRPVAASNASGGGSGRARSTGLGRTETAEAEVLADTLRLLGKCLVDMGETERAEKLLLESVALYEEHLGDDHPSLAIALEDLGFVYHAQALYDQARPAMERSLRIREKVFGPHHQSLAISSSYLASIAAAEGRFDEAETLLRRSVDIFSARLGPDHFNVGAALIFLADVFLQVGRLEAAEEAYERSLEIAGGLDVEASYNGLTARQGLGHVALARGRWRPAREHLEASVEPFVSVVGEASTEVVTSLIGLVRACHALGLRSEADRWLERADRASEQLVAAAPESPSALRARAEVELAMGAAAEARQAGSGRQRFETANRRLESLPGADREVHLQALRAEAMLRLGRDASELLAALERLGWADPFLWQLAGPGGAAETVASGR
ncbi:MAG: tetratricopeptide repeat protein [Holophagales bacterium]|nr:tetratricopeptide repeat protein [Holophagales bacterium]